MPDPALLPLETAALEVAQFKIRQGTDVSLNGFNLRIDDNHLALPQLNVDLKQETLDLPKFSLQALGINLEGEIQIKQLLSNLAATAELAVAQFNPKTVLKRLGQPVPEMTDPTVLKTLALNTQLRGGLSQLGFESLKIQLDDSLLQGNFHIQDFQRQAIAFYLDLDQIDLDRYLPPKKAEESQPESPPSSGGGEEELLPLEMLRSLNLKGTIKVGRLKAANLKINDISVNILAKNGQINVKKAAKLYRGSYSGNLSLDAQRNPPQVQTQQTLRRVQASPLLVDLVGDDRISGTANIEANLRADATTLESLQQTLDGPIKFQFSNGQFKGFSIGHALRQANALYQGEPLPKAETRLTDFANLQGTLVAQNGIVSNNDLKVESPLLRATGKGNVVMKTQEIDFLLTPIVVGTSTGQGGKALEELYGIPVPLRITGKLNAPTVRPDAGALKDIAKAIAKAKLEEGKLRLRAKAEEERRRIEAQAEAEKQRLLEQAKAKAEEERRRLQAKAEEERHRLQAKAEEERHRLQAKAEEERRRIEAKAEEEKQRLLEQAEAKAEEEKQKLLDKLPDLPNFNW